jgi:hypothetical protein
MARLERRDGAAAEAGQDEALLGEPAEVHPFVGVYADATGGVDVAVADVQVAHLENVPAAAAIAHRHGVPFGHLVNGTRSETKHWLRAAAADLVVYNSKWVAAECRPCAPRVVVRPPVFSDD